MREAFPGLELVPMVGNVLGSVGSVIPIFRRQLATTGKLTVTHAEASRFFMLTPEAAGLILQAGAMGRG